MDTALIHNQLDATVLKAELASRTRRNPRYSLRAFAKSLGVSHTYLSLVFAGKRRVTYEAGQKIAQKLGLHASNATDQLSLDRFAVISDWYHFAILSLLEIPDSKLTPDWIADQLGITPEEAQLAIARLKKLGLIARVDGRWRQTGLPIRMDNQQSTSATLKFQGQFLEKASNSLENDAFQLRSFRSMTLAMNPADIPYAAERIREFLRQLSRELELRSRPTTVYQLGAQVFPVSKPQSEPLTEPGVAS